MLGPYRLVERTEAVGLAEVWTAYHAGLRRYVVAKVLLPHLVAQPGYLERFQPHGQFAHYR